MNKFAFVTAFVFTALVATAPTSAETVNCTAITTLPYFITTQGVYCLTGHLSTGITTGAAITINTNNVVVDLNSFKIGGLAAGPGTQAIGIYAALRQNITIKNGTVRGFYYGILLDDTFPYTTSQGHVIEDIRADQNTYVGLQIAGNGNIIRNNQVVATGGTTVNGVNPDAIGVKVLGPGAQLLNNMVTEVAAQGAGVATGIYLDTSSNSVVAGNRVGNLTHLGGGLSIGIYPSTGSGNIVRDNSLSAMLFGILFGGGATGKYMNNIAEGVTIPYTSGTPAGTTNY